MIITKLMIVLCVLVMIENVIIFFAIGDAMKEFAAHSWLQIVPAVIFAIALYVLWTFQWA